MGRRLSLNLTHMQVRAIYDDAAKREATAITDEERQRWTGIAREAKRALEFHERTSAASSLGQQLRRPRAP